MSWKHFNRGRKEPRRILCRVLVYALNHPGASVRQICLALGHTRKTVNRALADFNAAREELHSESSSP